MASPVLSRREKIEPEKMWDLQEQIDSDKKTWPQEFCTQGLIMVRPAPDWNPENFRAGNPRSGGLLGGSWSIGV